jgi:transcriptional regulator with XRE-family HTH domain
MEARDNLYLIRYKMAPRKQMAAKLKALREGRGLTQEQLAKKSGVSRTYLARLETGRQDPTLSTLEKLAKALGVKVGRLVE